MVKIWKDKFGGHWLLTIGIGVFGVLLLLSDDYIFLKIPALLFIWIIFFLFLTVRPAYINQEGIFVESKMKGNLLAKGQLIEWKNVAELDIRSKIEVGGLYSYKQNILTIKDKKKQKFKYILRDTNGFIQALKDLKKDNLISKDSKYLGT